MAKKSEEQSLREQHQRIAATDKDNEREMANAEQESAETVPQESVRISPLVTAEIVPRHRQKLDLNGANSTIRYKM